MNLNPMKSQILSGALAVGLLAAFGPASFGQTVTIDRIDQQQLGGVIYGGDTLTNVTDETGDGGEFTIIPTNTSLLTPYSSLAQVTDPDSGLTGQVGFESFCLETGLSYPIPPGIPTNPLSYEISSSILNAATYQPGLTITLGTAWLYSQFATGVLTGYNYSNANAAFGLAWSSPRADDAAYLQAAIWYLESQPGITYSNAGGSSNPFLNLLTASTGSGGLGLGMLSDALVSDPGGYGVQVLNLGTPGEYQYQAQLILDPIGTPDGGTTLVLMGIATGGLFLLRRKLTA
jgi:hypothetical protein